MFVQVCSSELSEVPTCRVSVFVKHETESFSLNHPDRFTIPLWCGKGLYRCFFNVFSIWRIPSRLWFKFPSFPCGKRFCPFQSGSKIPPVHVGVLRSSERDSTVSAVGFAVIHVLLWGRPWKTHGTWGRLHNRDETCDETSRKHGNWAWGLKHNSWWLPMSVKLPCGSEPNINEYSCFT